MCEQLDGEPPEDMRPGTLADIYACRGSHSLYRSPLRALSVPMVHDVTGIGLDLDCTEIGDWRPEKVYAFHAALPEGFVRHHSLEELGVVGQDGGS